MSYSAVSGALGVLFLVSQFHSAPAQQRGNTGSILLVQEEKTLSPKGPLSGTGAGTWHTTTAAPAPAVVIVRPAPVMVAPAPEVVTEPINSDHSSSHSASSESSPSGNSSSEKSSSY